MSAVTIPNIPAEPSAWVRMWQWNAQHARRVRDDDRVPPLARCDVERVALERRRERIAVTGEHLEREPVKVRRVDHRPLVHEAEADPFAELRRVRGTWPENPCR